MASPEERNPYAVGEETAITSDAPWSQEETRRALNALGRWQAVFSILMMIGCGLAAVATLVSVVVDNPGRGDWPGLVGGLVCVGVLVVFFYLLPAVLLWHAAQSARVLARSMAPADLHQFVRRQLTFWFWLGILVIIVIAFYALLFIGAMTWRLVG